MKNPRLKLSVLAVATCYAGTLSALPTAPSVAAGQASISVQGKTLNVVNTPGTIINWGAFSVAADEAARFQQQSAASSVLNRVVGQDPSAILGRLQSNGRVFIINPNGIVFGAGSQIDVAGLVASSLHMSNADFLSGRMQFREQGAAGAVVNQGEIRTPIGGQVYLVAPRVENHGLITTPGGEIVLAAGKKVELVDAQNPSIRIEIAAPDNEALNVGKLVATGGRINMVGSVLRVGGRVSADAAVIENGKVAFRKTADPVPTELAGTVNLKAADTLTLDAGAVVSADGPVAGRVELQSSGDLTLQIESTVSASGTVGGAVSARAETGTLLAQGTVEARGEDGPGGAIRLQGSRVALLQRSRTDASGTLGGGAVLVGGGYQGNDASTQNALKTIVAPGAEIRADATQAGDGGTVVVWSDESTRYHGEISARGAGAGQGGLVEVSGKQHLEFAGKVDLSAESGRGGTLLLDPLNITLSAAADANTTGFTVPGDTAQLFADDAGLTSTFNVSANGSFAGIPPGSNIVLQATNNITAASAFNITAATGNTDVSLTLQANNSIAINAAITTSGTGNLTLIADNDGAGGGAITRTAAGSLTTGSGGSITLNASTGLNASVSAPSVSVSNRTSGAVVVTNTAANGAIAFAGNVAASALTATTNNGAVTQSGALTVTGVSTFNAGTAGDISLANSANGFSTVTITRARNVQIADANAVILGASTVSGNLAVTTANGAITQSGALVVPGTANFQAGTGSITLATTTNNFNVVEAAGQAISLRDTNTMTLGNVTAVGNLTLQTNGALAQSANTTVSAGGNTTITAPTTGDITLANAGNDFNVLRVVSGRNVQVTDVNDLSFGGGASAVSGALTVTAGGAVTQNSSLASTGLATFNTGTADLTLGNTANAFSNVSIVSAGNATLFEAGGLGIAATAVANNLTVTSTGAITDNGNIVVAGKLTLETRSNTARAITLDAPGNNFGSVSARTLNGAGTAAVAGTITLRENSAMEVELLTTTGAANLVAGGAITQSGAITVGGTFTANAGSGNDITLGLTTNNFGTVSVTQAEDVSLADADSIVLGAMTLSGNLSVSADNANITQSGALVVPGAANFQAGTGNVTLATTTNNFNIVEAAGQAISLRDANTMTLGNVSAGGALTLQTNGALAQAVGTAITAGGNTTLTAPTTGDITLANAGNDFTNLRVVTGRNVQVTDVDDLNLGGSGASAVSGTLVLNAGGAVTQSSQVSVTGLATFNIGAANDLTLNHTANAFSTVSIASAGNATLFEAGGFALGATTVASNLTVTSTGAITNSGNVTVPGRLTVETRNNTAQAITLNSAGNNFGSVSAQTMNGTGATVVAGAITLRENSAMDVALFTTSGAATLTANGAIGQTGELTVGTTLTANAGSANDITLNLPTNNFGTVAVTAARDVRLADANAIVLGAMTLSGNLAVSTANSNITQSANLVVPGTANLQAGTGIVNLGTGTANNFNIVEASGQTVSLRDANTMALGNVSATGNLTLTTAGLLNQRAGGTVTSGGNTVLTAGAANNITLANTTNDFNVVQVVSGNNVQLTDASGFNFGVGTSTVSGALTVTANGAVAQANPLSVVGLATFNIGAANDLTLSNASNAFASVAVPSAGNVVLRDQNAITLNASTVNGSLDVTSTNNTITVAGNISTAAANGAITFNSGTGTYVQSANIDLASGSGNIGVTANVLTINTNTGNNAFQTSGTLTLRPGATNQAMSVAGTGGFDLTAAELNAFAPGLNNAGGSLVIGREDSTAAMTIRGAHDFGAGSRVTLSAGSIAKANTAVLALTAGDLSLFANSGSIGAAGTGAIDVAVSNLAVNSNNQNAFVRSAGAVSFGPGTSNLGSGSLAVATSNGAITQSGAIVATGTGTSFNAGSAAVTLGNSNNDFGTVSIAAASQATLADANALTVSASGVAGGIGLSTGGNATVTHTGALVLRASTVLGSLAANANGAITQSGAVSVSGAATFNASGNAITLNNASNDFASLQVTNAGNTAITDANALALAGANVNGTLSLKTSGALTQTGALVATGLVTLDAGAGGNVTLTNAGNNFASVTVAAANNVSLTDAGGIDLGAFSVNGAISVVAGGDVSLSGVLQAAGAGNAIVLAAGGNFLNNAGTAALSATSGRWLVYSANPASNTFNGLASGNAGLWSHTYGANAPSSITQSGNRYIFSSGRTVTVTAANFSKVYGDDVTAGVTAAYTVSGLYAGSTGGEVLADTAASVLAGMPTVSSTGAATAAPVAGSPYAFTLGTGTLAAQNGYALSLAGTGQLTITPASLSIGVQDASRLEGGSNPPFAASYSGFKAGDGPGALSGSLQFGTLANPASPAGSYAVTPSGVSSSNYSIVFADGKLRVDPQFRADPLQTSYNALFGPSTAGLYDLQGSPPTVPPTFVVADAGQSLQGFLNALPATAAGGTGDNEGTRDRSPQAGRGNRDACSGGSPIALLRCRTATRR